MEFPKISMASHPLFFTLGTLFYHVCACISKFYTCKALEKQRSHYFRWHKISQYNVHICTLYTHLGNKTLYCSDIRRYKKKFFKHWVLELWLQMGQITECGNCKNKKFLNAQQSQVNLKSNNGTAALNIQCMHFPPHMPCL